MASDDRGLATGILGFVAIIVILALLYTLLNPAITGIHDHALSTTDDSQAQGVINERFTIWGYTLFFGLFLAAVYIIARAVFESRRPG